ncbi:hypothetical protein [Actinoplanes sp. RD1]|uniref:hypothetical protein n=1 Tax=Actinoplanes sp. RD1 TaxID=3064538 RepID=UPI002741425B|nr:hypothetical protein [Actinoplanes sp. RD1]
MSATTPEASPTATDLADLAARRYPLVPRPRPAAQPLTDRIRRVRTRAEQAATNDDDALVIAAETLNLAALIYSDCGAPDTARELCWRQYAAFADGGPYPADTAKLALQPLINIGRLHTRAGNGTTAYEIHRSMYQAAWRTATTTIEGRPVALGSLVRPGPDQQAVVQWLWTVLLADGLRALCRAGRWTDAADQATAHGGVGERPLDGRQIAIIASSAAGDHTEASRIIACTICTTAWERVILDSLQALHLRWSGGAPASAATRLLTAYRTLPDDPHHGLFLVRLGLTAIDIAGPDADVAPALQRCENIALGSNDAHAAWELLQHPIQQSLMHGSTDRLRAVVDAAGLKNTPSVNLATQLEPAVDRSIATLQRHLSKH